jgi:hypothetical protein
MSRVSLRWKIEYSCQCDNCSRTTDLRSVRNSHPRHRPLTEYGLYLQ